jgi:hypothetical protein
MVGASRRMQTHHVEAVLFDQQFCSTAYVAIRKDSGEEIYRYGDVGQI